VPNGALKRKFTFPSSSGTNVCIAQCSIQTIFQVKIIPWTQLPQTPLTTYIGSTKPDTEPLKISIDSNLDQQHRIDAISGP
uniref:Uncharacterized protein n=2 Tax=Aegilops tauschii subsp. strangulata TaxID=200361 RepID=A0A453SXB0_AEGTS